MISVEAAQRIILKEVQNYGVELCPLKNSFGRVLREDIRTDRDQPPFNKAMMDGIAIAFDVWKIGQRQFLIEGTIPAGQPPLKIKNKNSCVKIMTGAAVPSGFDCVIAIEHLKIDNRTAVLPAQLKIKRGQNIRPKGADQLEGKFILKNGQQLLAPHIGISASVGKEKVKVSRLPQIAVVATGDELVEIDRPIKSFQTRLSNSYALSALFNESRLAQAQTFHLPDKKDILRNKIEKILAEFDICVLSGGVSMGDFDYVPSVMKELGVRKLFHKVSQKPGKPFWFGKSRDGKIVFALPGNPVSTLVCAYCYVIPFLVRSLGVKDGGVQKVLMQNVLPARGDLTRFISVKLMDGKVAPVLSGGSGDWAALAQTNGFVQLPPGKLPKGLKLDFYSWRVE